MTSPQCPPKPTHYEALSSLSEGNVGHVLHKTQVDRSEKKKNRNVWGYTS